MRRERFILLLLVVIGAGCFREAKFYPDPQFAENSDMITITRKFWKDLFTVEDDTTFTLLLKQGLIRTRSTQIGGIKKEHKIRNYSLYNRRTGEKWKVKIHTSFTSLELFSGDNYTFDVDVDRRAMVEIFDSEERIGTIVKFKDDNFWKKRFRCILKDTPLDIEVERSPDNYKFYRGGTLISVIWKEGWLKYKGLISKELKGELRDHIIPLFILSREFFFIVEED